MKYRPARSREIVTLEGSQGSGRLQRIGNGVFALGDGDLAISIAEGCLGQPDRLTTVLALEARIARLDPGVAEVIEGGFLIPQCLLQDEAGHVL